ncbi:unnamed protein product [Phytomonas sp. EM1]|nr:unnamed protein product [Phytomonas sp. EM1]|eukprot:CCW62858.1 unnamed protein product [Phytomonas sp. isolate EM1]
MKISDSSPTGEGESTHVANLKNSNLMFDLRETVLQYLRTPDEFYINIILASLKSGMFTIKGDVFELAAGNPFLIKTFLDSSYVDLEDERVKVVVQLELDHVLNGEPHVDVLKLEQSDYLRCLCNVKSARISEKQVCLIRNSGFEFIKLIGDFPHLRKDIKPIRSWFLPIFRMAVSINIFTGWFSMLIAALFTASVLWTIVYWIMLDELNKAYLTIICYVCGYILSLVFTMRMEERRIRVYQNFIWSYPSNLTKIIPIIPLYECRLLYVALRYQLTPNKHQYFVIRYDLRNGMAMQQLINGLLHALPQITIQAYFNSIMRDPSGDVPFVISSSFWVILSTGICSFLLSMFSNIQQVVLSHSCDSFGFAMMSTEAGRRMLNENMPTHIMTRILIFQILAFIIGAIVTILIYLCNMHGCSYNTKTFIAFYFGIIWVDFFVLATVYVYVRFHTWYGVFSFPLILMHVIFIFFVFMEGRSTKYNECPLYQGYKVHWLYPITVLFGLLCFFCVLWLVMVFYEVLTGQQIRQRVLDTYFYM